MSWSTTDGQHGHDGADDEGTATSPMNMRRMGIEEPGNPVAPRPATRARSENTLAGQEQPRAIGEGCDGTYTTARPVHPVASG